MIVEFYFIIVMMYLHGYGSDCGFTITFYKVAGLSDLHINGQKLLLTASTG